MTDQADSTAPAAPRPRRRVLLIATLVVAAGLTGAAVTSAVSNPFGHGWHGGGFMGGGFMGSGFMGRGMHGPMGRMGGNFDPARVEERADRMVRHLAVELDASNEQQDKLRGIVRNALKEVLPAREKAVAARRQARELLTADSIDRAAIEKLRAEQIALADGISKRIAQALGDAAEVLTPDQRKKLDERFPFGGHRQGWRRG